MNNRTTVVLSDGTYITLEFGHSHAEWVEYVKTCNKLSRPYYRGVPLAELLCGNHINSIPASGDVYWVDGDMAYQTGIMPEEPKPQKFKWDRSARGNLSVIVHGGDCHDYGDPIPHSLLSTIPIGDRILAKWFTMYENLIYRLGGWNENGNPDFESTIHQFIKESREL